MHAGLTTALQGRAQSALLAVREEHSEVGREVMFPHQHVRSTGADFYSH